MTTMAVEQRTCDEEGCPFPGELKCLDGFDPISACPHISANGLAEDPDEDGTPSGQRDGDADGEGVEDADSTEGEAAIDEEPTAAAEPSRAEPMRHVGGNDAFDIDDINEFLQRETGTVVLIAGPIESGKTTLIVELYARFLNGPFAGAVFGGSETLRALGSRHFPALAKSGADEPTTRRTSDEDMRFLHLRLRTGETKHHNLLFTDVRGEYFENIVDGGSPAREISIAPRVDKCLMVIDGEHAADPRQHDATFTDALQLAGGLRADGGLTPSTPTAVLCTKWDRVPAERRGLVAAEANKIAAFAAAIDETPTVFTTAVRSGVPNADYGGLGEVLGWLTTPNRVGEDHANLSHPRPLGGERMFWKEPGSR